MRSAQMNVPVWIGLAVCAGLLTACGTSGTSGAETAKAVAGPAPETPAPLASEAVSADALIAGAPRHGVAAKEALRVRVVDAADPQFPIADLTKFDAVVLGAVEGFVPGPKQPVFEGDPDPIETVVMQVIVDTALQGDAAVGDPIYVRLFTEDLEGLKRAIPKGTPSLVAVSTVDQTLDDHLTDPYVGVPKGEPRYVAGAPYAAFADGELKTWFPLLDSTTSLPLSELVPLELAEP
jgi:hypothetical protein